jgi:transposase
MFMARRQKDPLRPLARDEAAELVRISHSRSLPAGYVARATALLAVSRGATFTDAARQAGRRNGDRVADLVARFNREGLGAVEPRHGGGAPRRYGQDEHDRILREASREPDREVDGTATWSLATLQRALQDAPDGLPNVSTRTIAKALHAAGYSWQRDRSWCRTGEAERKRKSGIAKVRDPDTEPKKN